MSVADQVVVTTRRLFRSGGVRTTLLAFVTARLIIAASFVATVLISDELADRRPDELTQGLLAWDGQWYQGIADRGYDALPLESVRFFPLFPYLGRVVSWLLPGGGEVGLVVVANVAALATGVLLHRLVREESGGPELADASVWTVMLFPSAFVLAWGYSESLMLAATLAALLAIRRERWGLAMLFGAAAGLSRPLGALLVLPAAWMALEPVVRLGWRSAGAGPLAARLAAAFAAPLAGSVYVLWASVHYDDFLVPFTVQGDFRGDTANPVVRVAEGMGELFVSDTLGDGLHVPFAVGFVVLAVLAARWLPGPYALYAGAVLVVSLAADNLNSLERYGLNAFPLLVALAVVVRVPRAAPVVLASSAAGLFALNALAATGVYVP